ncbi:MAG: class I SAM-dependent methyltransferase [Methanobacteriota archaeon]|nr:MAG: class I SAM-dependent methyltransferase [Euryarchaeota archaeon]
MAVKSTVKGVAASILRRLGYDVVPRRNVVCESISELEEEDAFVDSLGNRFVRLRGYRDLVKPGWRSMFEQEPEVTDTRLRVDGAVRQVREMTDFLGKFGFGLEGKDVLEIGCHDGRNAFALADAGARHVDAIDIPAYGVLQGKEGEPDALSLDRQSQRLSEMRAIAAESFKNKDPEEKVAFYDLDVTEMEKDSAYDLIVSWETLEHIADPAWAMARMYRALRPGGLSFHEYNPFYSLEGGHSLCTLDFPYGHARLSEADFERYVRRYRERELGVSMNFYRRCLNRMTIRDLNDFCFDAGFEILALCPWNDDECLRLIDRDVLNQCRKLKPNLMINDLLSGRVWVLMRKPVG